MVAFLKFQKVAFLLLFLLSTSFSFAQNHEAIRVYFHLGDSLVDENFKTNRESLSRLNQLIEKKGKNGGYSVSIVGTTSPEGLDEANQLLGLARANEVSKYVNRNGAIADSLLTKKSIGTDWVSVLENLKNVNFSFRDKATAIIKDKSISNGDKLLKLQSIESGKSLKYFNDSVYPFMRSAIITVAPISDLANAKNEKLSNIYNADSKSKNGTDLLKYWWVLLASALVALIIYYLFSYKSNLKNAFLTCRGNNSYEIIIDDDDIPSGNHGINKEGYTYGQLRRQPIIKEISDKIQNSKLKEDVEICNKRNSNGFVAKKINGEIDFSSLRVGDKVKLPNENELREILIANPKTRQFVLEGKVSEDMIRNVSYDILRNYFASKYGSSDDVEENRKETKDMIGKLLDCAPHEDKEGYVYAVPNVFHTWKNYFSHTGYAATMRDKINKRYN